MSRKQFYAILLAIAAPVGIVACATSESGQDASYSSVSEARDDVICRRQRTVGSHVPVRVCQTRGQMERDREAALNEVGMLRTMSGDLRSAPPPPPPASPPN